MREQLETFVKNRKGLTVAIVFIAALGLLFVVPKIFTSLDQGGKKIFWLSSMISFGTIAFFLFPQKKEEALSEKQEKSPPFSLSHQQLLDKVGLYLWELKKQQIWVYSCLVLGWFVIWIGKWSGHPQYSHPFFAVSVFALAFLAATRSWEKVHELDVSVANLTLEGINQERKKTSLKSDRFQSFANSFDGIGMWKFAFVRVSPSLMIILSLLNSGLLPFLINHFSFPIWVVYPASGLLLGALFLFFARLACRPYYWMLNRMKKFV